MTAFTITTDTLGSERVGSAADISDALARLDAGEAQFVILAKGPEDYLQTGPDAGGFTLERRDGSEETHRIAIHGAEAVANGSALSRAEIERAFLAYFRGVPCQRRSHGKLPSCRKRNRLTGSHSSPS